MAVDATLRAAAPYQRARRARTIADGKKERKVPFASCNILYPPYINRLSLIIGSRSNAHAAKHRV